MTSTIATFMVVDTQPRDATSTYPMLGGGSNSAAARRVVYWRNTVVFCATAHRCQPEARLVVITNDPSDLDLGGSSLWDTLSALNVERRFVPYHRFKPPHERTRLYFNVYYRFEALRALANECDTASDSIFLMDSDSVWTRPVDTLDSVLPQSGLFLHTPHDPRDPHVKHPHNLSRADMGDAFRQIDPAYPEPHPLWYGTDFIGGRCTPIQEMMVELERDWHQILDRSAVSPLVLANGQNLLDVDEYPFCYTFNRNFMPHTSARPFFRRLFTLEGYINVVPADSNAVIWHVPQEKQRGLKLLFELVMDSTSSFWTTAPVHLNQLLGAYLGIPRRRYDLPYTPRQQIERHLRIVARYLRARRSRLLARV